MGAISRDNRIDMSWLIRARMGTIFHREMLPKEEPFMHMSVLDFYELYKEHKMRDKFEGKTIKCPNGYLPCYFYNGTKFSYPRMAVLTHNVK